MSAPPPYVDPAVERLLTDLDRLNLAEDSDATGPRHQGILATRFNILSPTTCSRGGTTQYRYQSVTSTGYTPCWDEAAVLTQGVPGGIPTRMTPKKRKKGRPGAYVVFIGRNPAVYNSWTDVEVQTNGVRYTVHQGYKTKQAALAAFEYAHSQSWTRVSSSRPPSPDRDILHPAPIPTLPTPTSFDALNPLHGEPGDIRRGWYVVYRGITPGVYRSYLECNLNIAGLSGAIHESFDRKEIALERYHAALLAGRVKVIAPPYTFPSSH